MKAAAVKYSSGRISEKTDTEGTTMKATDVAQDI